MVRKRGGRLSKTLNQTAAEALLRRNGWARDRGGKYVVKMRKRGERPITLPLQNGRDYPPGLKDAILRQAGLNGAAMVSDPRTTR